MTPRYNEEEMNKITMVSKGVEKLMKILKLQVPRNKLIATYYSRISAVNETSAIMVYDAYKSNVYNDYNEKILTRDEDVLFSGESIEKLSEDTESSIDLIRVFVSIWNTLNPKVKKYVFDMLISFNAIIDSM